MFTAGTDGSFACQLSDVDEFRGTVVSVQSVQPPPPLLSAAQKLNDRNFFSAETSTAAGRQDAFVNVGQLQLPPPPSYSAAQPVTASSW